ncbi:hypothetical protein IC575_011851 [Cucumis melo]
MNLGIRLFFKQRLVKEKSRTIDYSKRQEQFSRFTEERRRIIVRFGEFSRIGKMFG